MDSSQNEEMTTLPPPADRKLVMKNKLGLVFELIWLVLLTPPNILLCLIRMVFPPRLKSLKGQVVLVTGAGRGLGRGLALNFAKEGAKVAVVDINKANAMSVAEEITKAGGTAKTYFTNVGKVEDIRRLQSSVTEELGPVDIVVNNAGLIHGDVIERLPEADLRGVIEVNLLSHFWMAKEFLPTMRERNSGHIVAICSASALGSFANASAYVVSKSGVKAFMEVLRYELDASPKNAIKTTTVFPYFVNTSEEYVNNWDLRIPPLSIEEVADAIVCGVRRDRLSFSVPEYLYFSTHLLKLLPQRIEDMAREIFHIRINLPPREEFNRSVCKRILDDLSKNSS